MTMPTMLTMKRFVLLAVLLVAVPTFAGQQQTGAQSGEPSSPAPSFRPVTTERLLNAAEDPAVWSSRPGSPKPQLANEKPPGQTVPYDELIQAWREGRAS